MLTDLLIRARALFRRRVVEQELDDELRAHLEEQTRAHVDAGLTPEQARRRAELELGGLEQTREECRDARGVTVIESLMRDVHYAARVLRRNRSFTVIVVLTLAVGIGATTTVFGVVNTVLIKPLPYPAVDRLVFPWRIAPPSANIGFDEIPWGRRDFLAFAEQAQTFEHIGAFERGTVNLTGTTEPVRLEGVKVSAGFFPALGVSPELGRFFTADEDRQHAPGAVVLSDRVWREQFNGDASIVGRVVRLNGAAHTVVGVMPPGFGFPLAAGMPAAFPFARETDVWVPLALSTDPPVRGEPSELAVVGRLRPGVPYEGAQAELDLFARQMERLNPRGVGWYNSRITPMTLQIAGEVRRPLWLLLAAVGVVLLITCSNIANLLLTRSVSQTRELALRAALGASRRRLIQQLVTENLLLAAIGGVVGVALAYGGVAGVKAFGPATVPRLNDVSVEPLVLAFAAIVSVCTGLLFGIAPAVVASREQFAGSLKDGNTRVTGDRRGARLRSALLVAEVALALVLVVASGLLARTFAHLIDEDGGFRADRVLTFELTLPPGRYDGLDRIVAFYGRVIDTVQALPGVEWAGLGETIPLDGNGESTALRIPDRVRQAGEPAPFANYTIASAGYLAALATPIRQGRDFLPSDRSDSLPVAIVNEAFARKYWPGEDAVGKRVGVPIESHDMTVVGVAANIKHVSLRDEVSPEIYVPFTQKPWPSMQTMHVAVRTKAGADGMATSIRAAVRGIDAEVPLARVTTLSALVDASLARPRFAMVLVGVFGALALLLAGVGLYGTVAYTVAGRTPEIGIRLALGAPPRSVVGLAIGACLRLTLFGIGIGVVLALAALRVMSRFLYGIEATDPLTLAGVAVLLLAVSLVACYLPARRAMQVDPLLAMRAE